MVKVIHPWQHYHRTSASNIYNDGTSRSQKDQKFYECKLRQPNCHRTQVYEVNWLNSDYLLCPQGEGAMNVSHHCFHPAWNRAGSLLLHNNTPGVHGPQSWGNLISGHGLAMVHQPIQDILDQRMQADSLLSEALSTRPEAPRVNNTVLCVMIDFKWLWSFIFMCSTVCAHALWIDFRQFACQ